MREKNLMWLVIFLIGFSLAVKIAFDNYKEATKPSEICYVDVPKVIEKLSAFYSIDTNASLDKSNDNSKKRANILINRLKLVLKNPSNFRCKAILMKGAVLSGGKDITKEVLDNVWGKKASQ